MRTTEATGNRMTTNQAAEAGVAFIGLYTLVMSLVALPTRVVGALALAPAFKAAESVTNSTGLGPASLRIAQLGLFATAVFTLAPGLVVLLARRRIAAWLLPSGIVGDAVAQADELLRIGFVLLGAYLTITAIESLATVGSTEIRVGTVGEFKSARGFTGPAVRLGCGVALCIFSRTLAALLGTSRQP